jgi:hypothetical protein
MFIFVYISGWKYSTLRKRLKKKPGFGSTRPSYRIFSNCIGESRQHLRNPYIRRERSGFGTDLPAKFAVLEHVCYTWLVSIKQSPPTSNLKN